MSKIPEAALLNLLEIGRRYKDCEDMIRPLLKQVSTFDEVNRLHWSEWDSVTRLMGTPDVLALFRGLVLTEKRLRWSGGSVAGAIWVFRELDHRDSSLGSAAADWALENSDNPWVPFGSDNLGARSSAEYRDRKAARQLQIQASLAAIAESERRAAEWRSRVREQRMRAAELRRSPDRAAFLKELSALPIPAQLKRLSCDQEFPVEWYPVRLVGAATTQILLELDQNVRLALLDKLKGRHRGPWSTFKRRLRESFSSPPFPCR